MNLHRIKEGIAMTLFNKILFPVDLSAASTKMCRYVKEMAEKFSSEIHLIFVVHVTHYYSNLDLSAAYIGNFETEIYKGAEKKFQDFVEAHFKGMPVKTKILVGRPADEIVNYAREEQMDLVVMGHSSTGIERAIFGSVAAHVVKYSPVPVLVISPSQLKGK
jgi:nucleotide-binding universal stress UspA family protein